MRRLPLAVVALGLAATAAGSWAGFRENQDSTQNILRVQTRQVGEVLVAAIPSVVSPLNTGAELAFNSPDAARAFRSYLAPYVSSGELDNAALWSDHANLVTAMATVGSTPDMTASSPGSAAVFHAAPPCRLSFSVTEVTGPGRPRFGYACSIGSGTHRYVVYAERPLPASRHAKVASNSAFSEIYYAIYFGRSTRAGALLASDFPSLPAQGPTSKITVPFGTTWLTVVTGPNGSLDGALSNDFPWFVLGGGLLVTLVAGLMTGSLVRRRALAEAVAVETGALNLEISRLLADQQAIAESLQRSLLPLRTPQIPSVAVATRYVPGSVGLEVGGDWYSVVRLDDDRFGFVIGDVSGHSIHAAAVMAALRFTIRTLVLEGHSPATVLDRTAAQVPDLLRGHLATVLIGLADERTRRIDLANAGHLRPLLVTPSGANYVETRAGVPLGVRHGPYALSSFVMPPGATLFTFTDGLVERRNEGLDTSLERLRVLAEQAARQPDVEAFVDQIIEGIKSSHRLDDDLAVLAVRWL